MTTIFVVRHGNTFAAEEQPRRIGVRTDLPLVESGRAQARRLGAYFRSRHMRFREVLAAPLSRSMQTAALILDGQVDAPSIETRAWLAEVDHGPDENRSEQAVIDRIGLSALAAWDEAAIPPDGWRVCAAERLHGWRALFDEQAGRADGNILLVTSNGAARFALLADEALAAQARSLATLKLQTGCFGLISLDDAGRLQLEAWNICP